MNSVIRIAANNPDSKIYLPSAADKRLSGCRGQVASGTGQSPSHPLQKRGPIFYSELLYFCTIKIISFLDLTSFHSFFSCFPSDDSGCILNWTRHPGWKRSGWEGAPGILRAKLRNEIEHHGQQRRMGLSAGLQVCLLQS